MTKKAILERLQLIPEQEWKYAIVVTVPVKENPHRSDTKALRAFDSTIRKAVCKIATREGFKHTGSNHLLSFLGLEYRPSDGFMHVHATYSFLWDPKSLIDARLGYFDDVMLFTAHMLQEELRAMVVELSSGVYPVIHSWANVYEPKNAAWLRYSVKKDNAWFLSNKLMKAIKYRHGSKKQKQLKMLERKSTNAEFDN